MDERREDTAVPTSHGGDARLEWVSPELRELDVSRTTQGGYAVGGLVESPNYTPS